MRIFLFSLVVLMFSSIEEKPKDLFFVTDSKVTTRSGDSLFVDDQFRNNSVIQTIENTNITSSEGDFEILLKAGTKAGFFQSDSTVFIIVYDGMARVSHYDERRYITIKTINNKYYTLNGGNIVLQTYGNSQQLSTTRQGLIVDEESILLGELFYSDKEKEEIMYLSKEFLDSSKTWLDSTTYYELKSFYLKPGNYPKMVPFFKTAYVNTKLAMRLEYDKRDQKDTVTILSYNIPEGAELKDGKIFWNPKEVGKFKFAFILTDGKDTVESYSFVRIKNSLSGKPKASVTFLKDDKSEIVINLSGIHSTITDDDGLMYRVTGNGTSSEWTSKKTVRIKADGSGFRDYKVEAISMNNERIITNITVDVTPVVVVKEAQKEIKDVKFFGKGEAKPKKVVDKKPKVIKEKGLTRDYSVEDNIKAYKNAKHRRDSVKAHNKKLEKKAKPVINLMGAFGMTPQLNNPSKRKRR